MLYNKMTLRGTWRKGIVESVAKGPDGHVREATVRTKGRNVKRNIGSL